MSALKHFNQYSLHKHLYITTCKSKYQRYSDTFKPDLSTRRVGGGDKGEGRVGEGGGGGDRGRRRGRRRVVGGRDGGPRDGVRSYDPNLVK